MRKYLNNESLGSEVLIKTRLKIEMKILIINITCTYTSESSNNIGSFKNEKEKFSKNKK